MIRKSRSWKHCTEKTSIVLPRFSQTLTLRAKEPKRLNELGSRSRNANNRIKVCRLDKTSRQKVEG